MTTKDKIKNLSEIGLFEGIPEEQIEKIFKVVKKGTVPAYTTIFRQNEPGNKFFVIISGKVRVFRINTKGVETELAILRQGEYFGEMALLTDEPRSASVETLEETQLLVLTKNQLDQILKIIPNISLTFVKQMANRLVKEEKRIEMDQEMKDFLLDMI